HEPLRSLDPPGDGTGIGSRPVHPGWSHSGLFSPPGLPAPLYGPGRSLLPALICQTAALHALLSFLLQIPVLDGSGYLWQKRGWFLYSYLWFLLCVFLSGPWQFSLLFRSLFYILT